MGPSLEQWETGGESFDGGTNPNPNYATTMVMTRNTHIGGGSEAKGGQDDGSCVTKEQGKPPVFKNGEAEGEPPA
jgi:hypothetical protein